MLGDWKWDCTSRTLVDSAPAGTHCDGSFFSAPISFDDSGNVITSTTTQKPTTTHLVQLPAGISASLLATLFIGSPSGSAGGQHQSPGRSCSRSASRAASVRRRAEHGDDAGQRELRDVIDIADHAWARRLEQAQAPLLLRCVDALHVADPAAPPGLPAHRLTQRSVHASQLGW